MINAEEILEQLVSFDTVGDKENGRIIEWIDEFSQAAGFETERMTNAKDGRSNLIVRGGNTDRNGLIFMGHTDTVPFGEGWNTEPLVLTRKKNDLAALGAADMKGGIAAMLAAMSGTDPDKLKQGLEFIFTYDEEKTLDGIKDVVARHKVAADCIVIGEPTSLDPVVATKGALVFKIDFIGKEAHGSSPERGVNAIEMAAVFIMELKKFFKKIEKETNRVFDLPHATLNIAIISGGDADNKVPSACCLKFEARFIDDGQKEKLRQGIAAVIKKNGLKAKVEEKFSLPVTICRNREFIARIEGIVKRKAIGVSYATEGSFLPAPDKGFVILGPGSIKDAHHANEKVSRSSLQKAVKIYERMIKEFCM